MRRKPDIAGNYDKRYVWDYYRAENNDRRRWKIM